MCEGVRRVLYVHEEFVRSSRDSGYRRTLIPRRRLLLRAVLGAVAAAAAAVTSGPTGQQGPRHTRLQ